MDVRTMLQASSPKSTSQHPQQQEYSCLLCKQRKVRCDRANPCSQCTRNGVDCIPGARQPYKRRKRHGSGSGGSPNELPPPPPPTESSTRSRGIQVYPVPPPRPLDSRPNREDRPQRQVPGFGQTLWTGLNEEFQDPRTTKSLSEDTSTDDISCPELLLSGTPQDVVNLREAHPLGLQAFMLWQIFSNRVNPLSKILHAPLVQGQVIDASRDFDSVSKPSMALLFSIYAAAVMSLKDDECQNQLNEPRKTLLARYFSACQQALAAASFMKSRNIVILQAFVIYLLTARHILNAESFWLLSGIAVRMGLRLQHRNDAISSSNNSIYESQLLRRLWWQIVWIDGVSSQLIGSKSTSVEVRAFPLPANLNDADINEDMTEMPLLHKGPTEMTFCLCRYEVGEFMTENAKKLQDPAISIREKDQIIDAFEAQMNENYLKYLDSAIPLHIMAESGVRSAICKLRLMAHHPSQFPDKGKSMPQSEKDTLFATSVQMVEHDVVGKSTKTLEIFSWHLDAVFQIDAFVFMLVESRTQAPDAPLTHKAWQLVADMYRLRPALLDENNNDLYAAIRELTLRAWEARETGLACRKLESIPVPDVILNLRDRKAQKSHSKITSNSIPPEASALHQLAGVATQVDSRFDQGSPFIDSQTSCSFQPDPGQQFNGSVKSLGTDIDRSGSFPVDWGFWSDLLEPFGIR